MKRAEQLRGGALHLNPECFRLGFPLFVLPFGLVSLFLGAAGHAQGPSSSACNRTGWVIQKEGSIVGAVVKANCRQIVKSVVGQEIRTHVSCGGAYSHMDSVACTIPNLQGFYCHPRGYKATLISHIGVSCPDLLGLKNGMSRKNWAELPANLLALENSLPQQIPTPQIPTQEIPTPPTGRGWKVWKSKRPQSAPGFQRSVLLTPDILERRRGGGSSDALLGQIAKLIHPTLAIELSAQVEVRHFDAGERKPGNVFRSKFLGAMSRDGDFDLLQMFSVSKAGETVLLRNYWLSEGGVLANWTDNASEHYAYAPSSNQSPQVWQSISSLGIQPLFEWVENPLHLSGFKSHRYRHRKDGRFLLVEHFAKDTGKKFVDRRHRLEQTKQGQPPLLQETEILDAQGHVFIRWKFSDVREISPGNFRPFLIEQTIFYDKSPLGRRVQWAIRFFSAEALSKKTMDARLKKVWGSKAKWLLKS